jgi:hypothetical protein
MKLYDIIESSTDILKVYNKRVTILTINDDAVAIQMIGKPNNDGSYIFDLHIIYLTDSITLPDDIFNQILLGIGKHMTNNDVHKVGIPIKVSIKKFSVNIGGHEIDYLWFVSNNNQERIMNTFTLDEITDPHPNLVNIQSPLPKFSEDFVDTLNLQQKKIQKIYKALKKGNINGVPYTLDDPIKIKVNYKNAKLDPDSNTIYPNYALIIYLHEPNVENEDNIPQVIHGISKRFGNFNIIAMF